MKIATGETTGRKVSERIAEKTLTTATLKAIPALNRVDGMLAVVVADYSLWVFAGASVVAASATILVPDAGAGRWHRIAVAAVA